MSYYPYVNKGGRFTVSSIRENQISEMLNSYHPPSAPMAGRVMNSIQNFEYNGYFKIIDASDDFGFKIAVIDGNDEISANSADMKMLVSGLPSHPNNQDGYRQIPGWISDYIHPVAGIPVETCFVVFKYDFVTNEGVIEIIRNSESPADGYMPSDTSRYNYKQVGRVFITQNDDQTHDVSIVQDFTDNVLHIDRSAWYGNFRLIDFSDSQTCAIKVTNGKIPDYKGTMRLVVDGVEYRIPPTLLPELFTGEYLSDRVAAVYLRISNACNLHCFEVYYGRTTPPDDFAMFRYVKIGEVSRTNSGLKTTSAIDNNATEINVTRSDLLSYTSAFKIVDHSEWQDNNETNQAENISYRISVVNGWNTSRFPAIQYDANGNPQTEKVLPDYNRLLYFYINGVGAYINEWTSDVLPDSDNLDVWLHVEMNKNAANIDDAIAHSEIITVNSETQLRSTSSDLWYKIGQISFKDSMMFITQIHISGTPNIEWVAPCGEVVNELEGWGQVK